MLPYRVDCLKFDIYDILREGKIANEILLSRERRVIRASSAAENRAADYQARRRQRKSDSGREIPLERDIGAMSRMRAYSAFVSELRASYEEEERSEQARPMLRFASFRHDEVMLVVHMMEYRMQSFSARRSSPGDTAHCAAVPSPFRR